MKSFLKTFILGSKGSMKNRRVAWVAWPKRAFLSREITFMLPCYPCYLFLNLLDYWGGIYRNRPIQPEVA